MTAIASLAVVVELRRRVDRRPCRRAGQRWSYPRHCEDFCAFRCSRGRRAITTASTHHPQHPAPVPGFEIRTIGDVNSGGGAWRMLAAGRIRRATVGVELPSLLAQPLPHRLRPCSRLGRCGQVPGEQWSVAAPSTAQIHDRFAGGRRTRQSTAPSTRGRRSSGRETNGYDCPWVKPWLSGGFVAGRVRQVATRVFSDGELTRLRGFPEITAEELIRFHAVRGGRGVRGSGSGSLGQGPFGPGGAVVHPADGALQLHCRSQC